MSEHSQHRKDVAFARMFSMVSRGLKLVPPLDVWMVGENTVPGGWRYNPANPNLYLPWVRFEGDPEGPAIPRPAVYETVGILSCRRGEMTGLHDQYPRGKQALALLFGTAMVVGELAEHAQLAPNPDNAAELLVACRISRDPVYVKPGVVTNDGTFVGVNAVVHDRLPVEAVPIWMPIA